MMLASSAPTAPPLLSTSTSQSSSSAPVNSSNSRAGDDCSSSTSPTNTSTSDVSMDMLQSLMNAAAAIPSANSLVKQESPPLPTPPLFTPDAVTLLQFSQLFQAQQAVAQFQAQAAQRQQQIQQQHQHHQQQQQQQLQQNQQNGAQERKRSYPCTFQYCVICQKDVHSSKLPCHIRQCHVAKPMFQCPACDFTSTYSKNNVKSHMVSLHGLAGDPISYMDKYAGQVEEYMKLCFPNVRGRGRPMQGRTSPKSPVSPSQVVGRRASQASMITSNGRRATVPQNDLLATLQQHQQQQQQQHQQQHNQNVAAAFNPLRNLRFNPLQSIFPSVLAANNNNNNSILAGNKHNVNVNNFATVKTEDKEEDKQPKPSCSSPVAVVSSPVQPIKPGENAQPKYMENGLEWIVLNDLQTKSTIFSDCRTNMEIYIENISRKIDSSTPTQFGKFVLCEMMRSQVENVRNRVNIQLFEVMFAIHRMDIKVLDVVLVELLLEIAPTNCDAQLLRKIENVTEPNEEFLMGLTKIDHIEEKLETMKHMHRFEEQISLVRSKLAQFQNAAKSIRESRAFRNVLQLTLAVLNVGIFDDKQCLTINGFSISDIGRILYNSTPSGQTIKSILSTILKDEINVDLDELFGLIAVLEKIEQDDFYDLSSHLSSLDDKTIRAERELEHSGSNQPLSEFVENAKNASKSAWEMLQSVKVDLLHLIAYLGNQLPRQDEQLETRGIIGDILHLLRELKMTIDSDEGTDAEDQHINILSP